MHPLRRSTRHTAILTAMLVAAATPACSGRIGDAGLPGNSTGSPDAPAGPGRDPGGGAPGGGGSSTPGALPPFEPAPAGLIRLTVAQYRNTVRDLVGDGLVLKIELEADPDGRYTTIGAADATTSIRGVERYEEAAREVAGYVFDDATRREQLVGCKPASLDDACVATFIASFGRRAWRRPLAQTEVAALLGVARATAAAYGGGDVWSGLRWATVALLSSPHFVYRVEIGVPAGDGGRLKYSGYEMASRISYFLWASMPDRELLQAAERGDLDHAAGVRAQARRLLGSPRARAAVLRFFAEDLHLEALLHLAKDKALFPRFSPTLGPAMREEIERLVAWIVFDKQAPITELLATDQTFVNAELAALYGLPAPSSAGFSRVTLPTAGGRRGLLGLSGFLALKARVTKTSPTIRGKFIREQLLCTQVPDPPPDVDAQLPETDPDAPHQTMRQKLKRHRTEPACAACHQLTDPLGLTYEHFDAIGAYRATDQGLPLIVSGDLDGKPYAGPAELAFLLRDDPRVPACLVEHVYAFATGHEVARGERVVIAELSRRFIAGGKRWLDLLAAIVASDGFRFARKPQ